MPLEILIVGGGIAGFATAIPLAKQGHTISIFEKSAFSTEIGAAIHLGPYAHHILCAWGIDVASLQPCICLVSDRYAIDTDTLEISFVRRPRLPDDTDRTR